MQFHFELYIGALNLSCFVAEIAVYPDFFRLEFLLEDNPPIEALLCLAEPNFRESNYAPYARIKLPICVKIKGDSFLFPSATIYSETTCILTIYPEFQWFWSNPDGETLSAFFDRFVKAVYAY